MAIGCARVTAGSEVGADGSIQRKVVFTVAENEMFKDSKTGQAMSPDTLFTLPSGPGWELKREKKDSNAVVTAAKTFPPNSAIRNDIMLMSEGKALTGNVVKVTDLGDGRMEYTERITWKGPAPKPADLPENEFKDLLSKSLPEGTATPAELEQISRRATIEVWRAMFGPPEPLIMVFFTHPDLGERRIVRAVGRRLEETLKETLGDRLTAEKRRETVQKLLGVFREGSLANPQRRAQPGGPPPDEANNPGSLTAVLVAAKVPGKILETNGEVDELSNEVTWAFFFESAQIEELVLRVVYQKP